MKKPTDFTRLMTSYLSSYLPLQRNVSQNTITIPSLRRFVTLSAKPTACTLLVVV